LALGVSAEDTYGMDFVGAGAKRRHSVMMMLDSTSSPVDLSIGMESPPGSTSHPPTNITKSCADRACERKSTKRRGDGYRGGWDGRGRELPGGNSEFERGQVFFKLGEQYIIYDNIFSPRSFQDIFPFVCLRLLSSCSFTFVHFVLRVALVPIFLHDS